MSEIPNFWLLALISRMPPYLIFILAPKSTHPVNMVLSSQNAQYFHLSAPVFELALPLVKTLKYRNHVFK